MTWETSTLGIPVVCHTNLDDYKAQKWPTSLPWMPEAGHYVQALSGKRLRVCMLTWLHDGRLEVELHR